MRHGKLTLGLVLAATLLAGKNARAQHCWDPPLNSNGTLNTSYISATGTCNIPYTNKTAGSGPGCWIHDAVVRCFGGMYTPWAIAAMGPAALTIGMNLLEKVGGWIAHWFDGGSGVSGDANGNDNTAAANFQTEAAWWQAQMVWKENAMAVLYSDPFGSGG